MQWFLRKAYYRKHLFKSSFWHTMSARSVYLSSPEHHQKILKIFFGSLPRVGVFLNTRLSLCYHTWQVLHQRGLNEKDLILILPAATRSWHADVIVCSLRQLNKPYLILPHFPSTCVGWARQELHEPSLVANSTENGEVAWSIFLRVWWHGALHTER